MPLTPVTRSALCQLGIKNAPEQSDFIRENRRLLTNQIIPAALEEMTAIQFGPLRMFPPAPGVAEDFLVLTRGIYALAAAKKQHEACATAAGALADFEQRFGEKIERDYWQIVQSVHSTLRYPEPKFGSTLDIIITTTNNTLLSLHDGIGEPLAVLGFLRKTTSILVNWIGAQSVPELLKFIQIPHDIRATTVSLAYLCAIHLSGLDTTSAVSIIQQAAQTPRDQRLSVVYAHALKILGNSDAYFEEAFDQLMPNWHY